MSEQKPCGGNCPCDLKRLGCKGCNYPKCEWEEIDDEVPEN